MIHPPFRRWSFATLATLASVAAVALLCPAASPADVTLATPFCDGAVLQRDKPLAIWGAASPGEKVKVDFKGQTQQTEADAQGRWHIQLAGFPASAEPAQLVVTGHNTVTVRDILLGDVWLCAGQSNMHFYVREAADARREIAAAEYPLIRQFLVRSVVADHPLDLVDGEWKACSPATAGDFTAVGYFFAQHLHRELKIPIGIIRATLGGSPIEGWMSEPALAGNPAFAVVAQRWERLRPRVTGGGLRNQPAGLYNGLIHPLEPFTLAGFVWYQGEGNTERATEYHALFTTMIQQWRADFQQPDLPFLFVQLPKYADPRDTTGQAWPLLREAQASALALPHTGMAVTIDIGDPAQLHPTNKQAVGRRLALVALAKVYGRAIESSGPVPAGFAWEGPAVRVRFDHATALAFRGDPAKAFEVAGADGRFVPADARIEGQTAIVSAPGVDHPGAVRFEWMNAPVSYLVNEAGLPASPFRARH